MEENNATKIVLRKNPDGTTTKVIVKKIQKKIKIKPVLKKKEDSNKIGIKKSENDSSKLEKSTSTSTSVNKEKEKLKKIIIKKKVTEGQGNRSKGEFKFKKVLTTTNKRSGFRRYDSHFDKNENLKKLNGFDEKDEEKDPLAHVPKLIEIPDIISIKNLSSKLNLKTTQVIKKLFSLGVRDLTVNDNVDSESAQIVCNEFGCEVKVSSLLEQTKVELDEGNVEDYVYRNPIVTVMGHVDHGKTTLLDCIRNTKLTTKEAGGITQHIGAYKVKTQKGSVLFIDTPGHMAFSTMRARGARITDIVILVVSAVDGVKPQTIEAIKHAKTAQVPIMVAVNKMDLQDADPERVKKQLMEYELVPEEWGGSTIYHYISALRGTGLEDLLESISLQAEVLGLKGNPKIKAYGYVIESEIEVGKGNTITVVIKNGTLKIPDFYLCGKSFGKIRAFFDENGVSKKQAGPSEIVRIIGLSHLTPPGELFQCVQSEKEAKKIVEKREDLEQETRATRVKKVTLSTIDEVLREQSLKEHRVIIKGDTFGSVEAIKSSLIKLKNEEIKVEVVYGAVGPIGESDVNLASTSNSVIIAFRVRTNNKIKKLADHEKVKILDYEVIYNIIEDIQDSLSNKMDDEVKEHQTSVLEVKEIFKIAKTGKVAGCTVSEGKVTKKDQLRLIRDGVVVYKGEIESLYRFKDEVKEVVEGMECGISLKNYQDVRVGDKIESYREETIKTSFET